MKRFLCENNKLSHLNDMCLDTKAISMGALNIHATKDDIVDGILLT